MALYLVIERFHNGDPAPIYRRFRERGRLMPEGLQYVASWICTPAHDRCYQVMQTEDRALLEQWMANWNDLMDFEVHPVIASADMVALMAARRGADDR